MDQINNTSALWPPSFAQPPSPLPLSSDAHDVPFDHDFILNCIVKQKTKTIGIEHVNWALGDSCDFKPSCNDANKEHTDFHSPLKKRARNNHVWRNKRGASNIIGILHNSSTTRYHASCNNLAITPLGNTDEAWHIITLQNNNNNFAAQERRRGYLGFPVDLSKDNRSSYCPAINKNWALRYAQSHTPSPYHIDTAASSTYVNNVRISLPQTNHKIATASPATMCPLQLSSNKENQNHKQAANHRKRRTASPAESTFTDKSVSGLLNDMKANLHSRAERKITRIATWNINNGFDHLAIVSIMAKNDIDVLALQEPRISHSSTDDVWISTMRKELRKCKYELITTQYSYIIFDEQTSGAALASIIRQNSKVNGRVLSVTFKSNDIWEVHTVISLYAVTNAKSGKKYARSQKSRKDVNNKLTKALRDEILFLQETYGDAPITVIGDYQDTIHTDSRDNIGMIGRKQHSNSPLYMLLNLGFQSAFHLLKPNHQQVTRWNVSKTAGRHIDLQMINDSAASLLLNVRVDDVETRNHITSDHLIVIADYNIEKVEQNIIDSYRTKINFRKIAGIKMKCDKILSKCLSSSMDHISYNLTFDTNQFMSSMVQDQLKMLEKWQHEANSSVMNDILTMLESSMQALEEDVASEDNHVNEQFDHATSNVQRKLVDRSPERRATLDGIYNSFQKALYQIATTLKIISTENRHVDALCTRQAMKLQNTKRYGENIINLTAPTSKIRSALGDLKHAEATLRNLQHNIVNSDADLAERGRSIQHSLQTLSKNQSSFKHLIEASSQISQNQEENFQNETAIRSHRTIDAFSGSWDECKFSSTICKDLISKTNETLLNNNVKQRIGVKQLDQSATDEDYWSDLNNWWTGPDLITLSNTPNTDINSPDIADAIQNALTKTRRLKKKAMAILVQNKAKILQHDSRLNRTRNVSHRLNPKLMDEPEAHHVILDPDNIHKKSNIRCNNFQQCLDNSLLYHQNWMDRSGSTWEHLWFQTTKKFGHINGIHFRFSGKPTDEEFRYLVKQHQECSDNIRLAFQNAHSEELASVMQPPRHPHRALDWLWHPNSTDSDWQTFTDNYWKAISSIPGKARYNGYTMAVIGRLPRRWIHLHIRIVKMMMILRIFPKKTKIQARVPIPKPKPGETRPLSLINDDMCFILGFLTKHYALKCEEIKLFPPTLHAYRQGMSTSFITLVDLAMREDALSFGRYMALTAEDEEKFFDRVSLEVQLAVLFILGFPMEGLLEMKAEEMDNISVEIHTRHGLIIGKFLHGLKQGSPLSCLISNLVLIFKHRVWGLRDPLSKADDPNGYAMTIWNKSIDGDVPPLVSMEGFCDDNSKWNMGNGQDFATLIQAIQWNIKLAGDLSMVFKIGRRGDKTIIELFNVNLEDIHLLPANGFTSIAWDFKANRPTEEEVDCRVYLKYGASLPSTKPESITDSVWNMLIKGSSLKSERSLGIWRNQFGDTSDSANKRAFLFGAKVDRLNLSSLKNDKTIKIAVNSLVVPVYQFGILENNCCPDVYDKMDKVLIEKVHKALGFAWCDAKQLTFVSEANFGLGIRSISVEMLKSICRELEIQLNDETLIGQVLRGRLETFKSASFRHAGNSSITSYDDINQGVRHFIMDAIRHIAHYGFFTRDMTDIKSTYQIEAAIFQAQHSSLFKTFKHHTLGMDAYAGMGSRSGTTLGHGDPKLLWGIMYGRCHTLLNGRATHSNVKFNLSTEQLKAIQTKATELLRDDLHALYTVFEWPASNLGNVQSSATCNTAYASQLATSINNPSHWQRFSALTYLKHTHNEEDIITVEDNFRFLHGLLNLGRDDLLRHIEAAYIQPNRLKISDIEFLLTQGWPLIIATDGGADKFKGNDSHSMHSRASASVVILHPPATPFAYYSNATKEEQAAILNHNLLPWKARACPLPTRIGDQMTDNAHAECFAIILMEEWLPLNVPIIHIMDSEAERARYHQLRNLHNTTNRFLIRSLLAGVSKSLGCRLLAATRRHVSMDIHRLSWFASNIINCCSYAKRWCYTDSGQQSLWKLNQWEPGQLRSVWAIRSHQLDSDFCISPKNRYGSQLVPNRLFVSANQWADNVCNAIMRFTRNAVFSQDATQIRKWCPPTVAIGLTGPNFIITHNGLCLDRCISTAVEDACNQEFIRRLALRPTQGLLIRFHHELFIKPEMIGRQSYHRRLLEGKTKTHTRAMYTDATYRKAIVYTYARIEDWVDDTAKVKKALKDASKIYKYLRCPFCTPTVTHHGCHVPHIFHEHASEHSGLFGSSRHFRFYCLNKQVLAVRQQMTQLLEDHLTNLLRIASKWGRTGFSTLLDRVAIALTVLDRAPFHNAHLMNLQFAKTNQNYYACFAANDWLIFLESQSKQVETFGKNSFFQWPLVHQFGFIAANSYTALEMQDGEYSPCDLLPLGVIPMALQNSIIQFANELGVRHSSEAKKDFLLQWQQIRAVALLRAISIAMVVGAQISEHKRRMLDELPPELILDSTKTSLIIDELKMPPAIHDSVKRKPTIPAVVCASDQFPCVGITCSPLFEAKTNLRPSLMRTSGATCRRCSSITKAITCAQDIEATLAKDLVSFRSFHDAITGSDVINIDVIIAAVSKLKSLPVSILPTYLKRASKRNVYPNITMNMVRFLSGTFNWQLSSIPTSIDVIFNQTPQQQDLKSCQCDDERKFFAVDNSALCSFCAGASFFVSTVSRFSLAKQSFKQANISANHKPLENNNKRSSKSIMKHYKQRSSGDQVPPSNVLRDSTNTSARPPLCLTARPNDSELRRIIQANNMLSNFVVSYFFKLISCKFKSILYQEFIFDFVKSEGGWKQFVLHCQRESHYTQFLTNLLNQNSACIIPICYHAHWTLLIRRYIGNSWKIFFLDSLSHDSEERFNEWKSLFQDDSLFSGEWIKVRILQQSELECGARVCVHGVCYALSNRKVADITYELSKIKDLPVRSRRMVSAICTDGYWSYQNWLSRIIGDEESLL